MTRFWVSWWHTEELGVFDLKWPCWLTGQSCEEQERLSYCAAVKVKPGEDILSIIADAYSIEPNDLMYIEWRFVIQKPKDWSPYSCDRFQRKDWSPCSCDRFQRSDDSEKFWNRDGKNE